LTFIEQSGNTRTIANYNPTSHSCDLVRLPKEGSKCTKQSDCGDLSLNCDTKSKKCKREYYAACLQTSDCLTSLTCINQQCDCVSDKMKPLQNKFVLYRFFSIFFYFYI